MKHLFSFLFASSLFVSTVIAQQVQKKSSVLQSLKSTEIPHKYDLAMATEGMQIGRSKKLHSQEIFICYNYSGLAFVKINNKVNVLTSASFKENINGYVEVFSNSNFKLIIRCLKVEDASNSGPAGWSYFSGNIELYDKIGNRLELVQGYFGEGM
jgi:hypothetical protein